MENGGQTPRSHRVQLIVLGVLLVAALVLVGWLLLRRPAVAPVATANKTQTPAKVQLALFASGSTIPQALFRRA